MVFPQSKTMPSTKMAFFFAIVLFSLTSEISTQGQKKGFRGGDRSYGIKVEANPIGTNLQYKLPEAKAKSSSPTDWQVDNDNAEMIFAMNSPILATVITTNPKFSVKGQWPGYKTTLTLPKDVKTGSKKNELIKLDDHQGSGSGHESLRDEEILLGSGNIKNENEKNYNVLSSEGYDGLRSDIEDTSNDSSGSGSAYGDSESRQEESGNQIPKKESEQKQERRSNVARNTKAKQNSEEFKDLSFKKVKLAVENLKHFNLKDPRTNKALKDIIIHAKKVVKEAKTVLSDVASVVTSVRDFVNGNYNLEEKDKTRKALGKTFSGEEKEDLKSRAKKAREEAEEATLQDPYEATSAQAASEMARKFANKMWKSSKTFGTLGNSRNIITVKHRENEEQKADENVRNDENVEIVQKRKETEKKQGEIFNHEKEMDDVLKNIENVLSNSFFETGSQSNKNVTQHHGNKSVTQAQYHYSNHNEIKENHDNQIKNVSQKHSNSNLRFMVVKPRDGGKNDVIKINDSNHRNYNVPAVVVGNKKNITENEKEAKKSKYMKVKSQENSHIQEGKKYVEIKNITSLIDRRKYAKKSVKNQEGKRKDTDLKQGVDREALKVAIVYNKERKGKKERQDKKQGIKTKAFNNVKNQSPVDKKTIVKERLHKTQNLQSEHKYNHAAKVLTQTEHQLPGDANEVVKNTEAHAQSPVKAILVTTGKKDVKIQIDKRIPGVPGGLGDVDGNDNDDDDVNSDSGQSGSTISGSYDIELELEPEKLEFVKGEGKMNEKRIRIKDLITNGEKKVPPSTFKEVLKAIKRVEGILGFTIEKTKTNDKKSYIRH